MSSVVDDKEEIAKVIKALSDPTSKYYVPDMKYPKYESKLFGGQLSLIDGVMPLFAGMQNIHSIRDMKVRPDDVFSAGFIKSGTTWIEEIIWLLVNNLDYEKATRVNHWWRIPNIDIAKSDAYLEELESPRVFKTNLPIQYLPENVANRAKVVYIVRNPKDMLVSAYHFLQSLTLENNKFLGSFDEMVDLFLKGEFLYGHWWSHVDGFVSLPQCHVVEYETLLLEPEKTIKELASFLNRSYSDDQIKQLIEFTSLKSMRENNKNMIQIKIDVNIYERDIEFFRQGKIGDWRNYFSDEMAKRVDDAVTANLKSSLRLFDGSKS